MLPALEFFQTVPARQNSKISRPSSSKNFRLRVPVILHHRLPEYLQQLREEKMEPSDKSSINCETFATCRPPLGSPWARRNACHSPKVLWADHSSHSKIAFTRMSG